MFNPLQQVYIDSIKKQLEEANEILKEVDEQLLYYPDIYKGDTCWFNYRKEKLKAYKKKYGLKKE